MPSDKPASGADAAGLPTALVIVDPFTSFGTGTDKLLKRRAAGAIPAIATLIERARAARQTVVYVHDRGDAWSASPNDVVAAAVARYAPGVLDPVVPAQSDPFLFRIGPSVFDQSGLEQLLLSRGIRRIVVAGSITERTILQAAIDASARGFKVTVPRDAVSAVDETLAETAFTMMERHAGAVVAPASKVAFVSAAGLPDRRRRARSGDRTSTHDLPVASADATALRRQLLTAFAVVVAREGFAGARVASVAREARVSLRTFYSEFSGKEECFVELFRVVTDSLLKAMPAVVQFDQPWPAVIHRSFAAYFERALSDPGLVSAFLLELPTLGVDAQQERERVMDRFAALLVDTVDRGRAAYPDVPVRPISHLAARAFVGATNELIVSQAVEGEADLVRDLVDTAAEMLSSLIFAGMPPASPASEALAA